MHTRNDAARSREDEEKRINKEKANILAHFKGNMLLLFGFLQRWWC